MKHVLVAALLFSNILMEADKANSQQLSAQCGIDSDLLHFVNTRIKQSNLVSPHELTCEEVREIGSVDPNSFELTTGRKNGESVLCLGSSREYPCQYVVAKVNSGVDPTLALANIFSVTSRDKNAPLNETVERLFIKPSATIR